MRLIVVLSGAFGFVTTIIGSIVAEKPPETSLVNGLLAALIAGILLRWWMKIWIRSLERVSHEDEMAARLDRMEPK